MSNSPDVPNSAGPIPPKKGTRVVKDEILPAEAVSRFSAVLADKKFNAELERIFLSEWHWGTPQEVRVQPLKAHKNRCTFEIFVKTESSSHTLIGKVHTADRSDVFAFMHATVKAGFGSDSEFAIPKPLAYLSPMHILFEEKIRGRWAMVVFREGGQDEQITAAQRCGAWLARFHTLAPRQGNTAKPSDLLPQIRYWTERIKTAGEPFANKCESLMEELVAVIPDSGSVELCPGHGSYMPEHVFLNSQRTIAFDLDEFDVADPGRDLAWFVVSLKRLGLKELGSLSAHDAAVEAFLKTYAKDRYPESLKHLPFFKAAECLHRAHRDLYKRIPPVPEWADMMLDEGLRTL